MQVLLIHGDKAEGTTTFTDANGRHTVTAVGAGSIVSTGWAKFGSSSLYVPDIDSRYWTVTTNMADFNFRSANFTIDFWLRPVIIPVIDTYLIHWYGTSSSYQLFLSIRADGSLQIRLQNSTEVRTVYTAASAVTSVADAGAGFDGNHVALVREAGVIVLYVDGVAQQLYEGGAPLATLAFAAWSDTGTASHLYLLGDSTTGNTNAWMDEVRILNGEAAWSANFTPETSAYTPDTYRATSGGMVVGGNTQFVDPQGHFMSGGAIVTGPTQLTDPFPEKTTGGMVVGGSSNLNSSVQYTPGDQLEIAVPSLSGVGSAGAVATATLTFIPIVSGTGATGMYGYTQSPISISPTISYGIGNGQRGNIPIVPVVTGQGIQSKYAYAMSATASFAPIAAGAAYVGNVGLSSFPAAYPAVAGIAYKGAVGNASIPIIPTLAASGIVTKMAISPGIEAAVPTISNGVLVMQVDGQGSILNPVYVNGQGRVGLREIYKTINMSIDTGQVTEYTNFAFNSYASFNGVMLAAGADGIYSLTGNTDNGTQIDASFITGASDMDTPKWKRMTNITANVRAPEGVKLVTVTDEKTLRRFRVSGHDENGVQRRRSKGRTPRLAAGVWQIGIENLNGGTFELADITTDMEVLSRTSGPRINE